MATANQSSNPIPGGDVVRPDFESLPATEWTLAEHSAFANSVFGSVLRTFTGAGAKPKARKPRKPRRMSKAERERLAAAVEERKTEEPVDYPGRHCAWRGCEGRKLQRELIHGYPTLVCAECAASVAEPSEEPAADGGTAPDADVKAPVHDGLTGQSGYFVRIAKSIRAGYRRDRTLTSNDFHFLHDEACARVLRGQRYRTDAAIDAENDVLTQAGWIAERLFGIDQTDDQWYDITTFESTQMKAILDVMCGESVDVDDWRLTEKRWRLERERAPDRSCDEELVAGPRCGFCGEPIEDDDPEVHCIQMEEAMDPDDPDYDPAAVKRAAADRTGLGFVHDDGGRAESGRRGSAGDCVARSLAIATGEPYDDVYNAVADANRDHSVRGTRSARNGVDRRITDSVLGQHGFRKVRFPDRTRPTYAEAHRLFGDCIVSTTGHVAAIRDGALRDTHDGRVYLMDGRPRERKAQSVYTRSADVPDGYGLTELKPLTRRVARRRRRRRRRLGAGSGAPAFDWTPRRARLGAALLGGEALAEPEARALIARSSLAWTDRHYRVFQSSVERLERNEFEVSDDDGFRSVVRLINDQEDGAAGELVGFASAGDGLMRLRQHVAGRAVKSVGQPKSHAPRRWRQMMVDVLDAADAVDDHLACPDCGRVVPGDGTRCTSCEASAFDEELVGFAGRGPGVEERMHEHVCAAARALGEATKHIAKARDCNREILGGAYHTRLDSLLDASVAIKRASALVAHSVGATSPDGEVVD